MLITLSGLDGAVAERLGRSLLLAGLQSRVENDLDVLQQQSERERGNLLVLDPGNRPWLEAVALIQSLREQSSTLLLVVSDHAEPHERVQGLDAGADDFLSKPFAEEELAARVRSLLRRHPLYLADQRVRGLEIREDLSLDMAGHRLVGSSGEVPLTYREFRLLCFLVRHEGIVLTREAILNNVWGYDHECSPREVDVFVSYLRHKVEPNPAKPRFILSSRGRGYIFARGQ